MVLTRPSGSEGTRFSAFAPEPTLGTVSPFAYSGVCNDIANSILGHTVNYRYKRKGFLREGIGYVMDYLIGAGTSAAVEDGVTMLGPLKWGVGLGLAGGFAAYLEQRAADSYYLQIVNGWMVASWNDHNCDTQQIQAGPYFLQSNWDYVLNSPQGDYRYVCTDEPAQLQWSDGTVKNIVVTVCQFVNVT
jgi:hypothetical protein